MGKQAINSWMFFPNNPPRSNTMSLGLAMLYLSQVDLVDSSKSGTQPRLSKDASASRLNATAMHAALEHKHKFHMHFNMFIYLQMHPLRRLLILIKLKTFDFGFLTKGF